MSEVPISGTTAVCAIIGDPVEHTMSPAIHNAGFQKLGLDYVYVAFRVGKDRLPDAINGMRAFKIRGMSVTIPHKVAVIPLLDELDPLAEKIGAVNTIVNNNGVLKGYNTDASGFLESLLHNGIEPKGKNIVVLGAGGASRAVSFILAERGAKLVILNRASGLSRAKELAERITRLSGNKVEALEMSEANLEKTIAGADVLVNATSVGMLPKTGDTPVPTRFLRSGLVVSDIIFNPIKTRLLQEAEGKGAKIINGVDMLVWQGVSAFKLWTGAEPPVDIMKGIAVARLQGHEK